MMRQVIAACAVAVAAFFCGQDAEAAQCNISTTAVSFGTYDVFTPASLDSVGNVVLRCSGNARNVMITINEGQAGTFSPRKLFLSAADWLGYNLYRDAARSVVWGNGTGGTSFFTAGFIPNNSDVPIPIYGRVPPSQDVRAGAYADSLSVTVNF